MQTVKVGDAIVHRDKIGKCRDSAPYLIYIISCIWMMLSSNMNTFNTFMLSLCYKHERSHYAVFMIQWKHSSPGCWLTWSCSGGG